jgi:hypothetical protein
VAMYGCGPEPFGGAGPPYPISLYELRSSFACGGRFLPRDAPYRIPLSWNGMSMTNQWTQLFATG